MITTLTAFTWLRWRLLVNRLRDSRRRDAIEQVSRAAGLVVPALLAIGSVLSIVLAVVLGAFGGWFSVAHPAQAGGVLTAVRVNLLLATIFAVLVPLLVGIHGSPARVTRLLLLPIPRRTLHGVEVCACLADPWMAFVLPGLMGYAVALISASIARPEPWLQHFVRDGFAALAAGIGMALVLVSLGSLAWFLVSWLVRDRRRGEAFVIVFVLALSCISVAPAFASRRLQAQLDDEDAGRAVRGAPFAWVTGELPAWSRVLPSELYGAAVSSPASRWPPLAALFGEGLLLYGWSSRMHRTLMESIESGRRRTTRRPMQGVAPAVRLPGMWPGTSAVALAQIRTGLRSVRGRLVVLLPGPIMGLAALFFRGMRHPGVFESAVATHGYLVFGAAMLFGLYAAQAFTMNQFGSDRAGLTLEFLAPIRDIDLVRGKAIGCAVIVGAGAVLSLVCTLLVMPDGSPWQWVATICAGAAAFLLLAPVSALLSVVLPIPSDLSKTGAAGNPHTLAMVTGVVLVAVVAAPLGIGLALWRPVSAFLAMVAVLGGAWVLSVPLLKVAARVLRARRENLALIAEGR